MEQAIALAFSTTILVAGFGYLPQIRALIRSTSTAPSFSLTTWGLWIWASFIATIYNWFILGDLLATTTTILNGIAQLAVVGIVLYKRNKHSGVSDVALVA
jgi:hypothetical protein